MRAGSTLLVPSGFTRGQAIFWPDLRTGFARIKQSERGTFHSWTVRVLASILIVPRQEMRMERKTAHDFDQELLILFDAYVHGAIDRRGFLDKAGKFAVGGVTAAMLLDELSPKFAEAQVVRPDDGRIVAEHVEYESPAGYGKMRGYLVRPKSGSGKLPGILVVHENRGLNPHIEDIARRLGLENFVAFAPDALFPLGGYPGDEDKARELFQKLDQAKTREDMIAAYKWLKARPECTGRVGAVGFCWGGGIVNILATQLPDLAAAVPFYGSPPNLSDVPNIKAPLLIQSAEVDERINAAWPDYEAALKKANVRYERQLYPGTQHGFNNDTTPRYDAAAAKLAWQRTLDFFNKHVRG
jgi:carboxymethylenebutenolidase